MKCPSGLPSRPVDTMKRISVREEVCIGCHLCEVWCIVEHSESKDPIICYNMETPRPIARVSVEEKKPVSFPIQCRQCEEPLCVYSCPSGAMHRDPDGVIRVDTERCQACWTCVLICPFGAIRRGETYAIKCDLCQNREIPACVEHCPNEAIQVMDE